MSSIQLVFPQRFEVAYELDQLEPEQYAKLEGEIHKELAQYRVNPKREFFQYPADDAIQLLKKLHSSALKEPPPPALAEMDTKS